MGELNLDGTFGKHGGVLVGHDDLQRHDVRAQGLVLALVDDFRVEDRRVAFERREPVLDLRVPDERKASQDEMRSTDLTIPSDAIKRIFGRSASRRLMVSR